jgi:hypothetical protein
MTPNLTIDTETLAIGPVLTNRAETPDLQRRGVMHLHAQIQVAGRGDDYQPPQISIDATGQTGRSPSWGAHLLAAEGDLDLPASPG